MKRFIITEEEKKNILSLYQNLNIKGILQEGFKDGVYTTDNDNKMYFGSNTYYDSIDIPAGTKFKRFNESSTDTIYADLKDKRGRIFFDCVKLGTVKFKNDRTANKHFTYIGKTYWANALQNELLKYFCKSSNPKNMGCLKGDCKNGYGEIRLDSGLYKGNFKNGNWEGYGTYTYNTGNSYQGNWKDGKFNGKGKYIGNNGSIWWGEFKENYPTDKTYYKNIKGCYFKGKPGNGGYQLSGKDPYYMNNMECTPGKWIDLEKQGENNNAESNQGGNNNSGSNQGGQCSNWNNCSKKDGTTNKFMKCDRCSEIGRLQACLRDKNGNPLKTDKAWGKNTEEALNKLGYNGTVGITSADITKICDDLLANQTKFNSGDFGDGSDENFSSPQPDTK